MSGRMVNVDTEMRGAHPSNGSHRSAIRLTCASDLTDRGENAGMTTSPYGWTGTIARVDLSSGQTHTISSLDMAHEYIGGRGFAARLYWDEVSPETDALSPDNPLMLMAGPLAGTPAIACSRLVVSGKSPLLMPDQYGHATMGGSVHRPSRVPDSTDWS